MVVFWVHVLNPDLSTAWTRQHEINKDTVLYRVIRGLVVTATALSDGLDLTSLLAERNGSEHFKVLTQLASLGLYRLFRQAAENKPGDVTITFPLRKFEKPTNKTTKELVEGLLTQANIKFDIQEVDSTIKVKFARGPVLNTPAYPTALPSYQVILFAEEFKPRFGQIKDVALLKNPEKPIPLINAVLTWFQKTPEKKTIMTQRLVIEGVNILREVEKICRLVFQRGILFMDISSTLLNESQLTNREMDSTELKKITTTELSSNASKLVVAEDGAKQKKLFQEYIKFANSDTRTRALAAIKLMPTLTRAPKKTVVQTFLEKNVSDFCLLVLKAAFVVPLEPVKGDNKNNYIVGFQNGDVFALRMDDNIDDILTVDEQSRLKTSLDFLSIAV
jgi:hypothetical protein